MPVGIKPPSSLIGNGETKKRQEILGSSPLRKQIGELAVKVANDTNRQDIVALLISLETDQNVLGILIEMSQQANQTEEPL